jgi:hypothetical protein
MEPLKKMKQLKFNKIKYSLFSKRCFSKGTGTVTEVASNVSLNLRLYNRIGSTPPVAANQAHQEAVTSLHTMVRNDLRVGGAVSDDVSSHFLRRARIETFNAREGISEQVNTTSDLTNLRLDSTPTEVVHTLRSLVREVAEIGNYQQDAEASGLNFRTGTMESSCLTEDTVEYDSELIREHDAEPVRVVNEAVDPFVDAAREVFHNWNAGLDFMGRLDNAAQIQENQVLLNSMWHLHVLPHHTPVRDGQFFFNLFSSLGNGFISWFLNFFTTHLNSPNSVAYFSIFLASSFIIISLFSRIDVWTNNRNGVVGVMTHLSQFARQAMNFLERAPTVLIIANESRVAIAEIGERARANLEANGNQWAVRIRGIYNGANRALLLRLLVGGGFFLIANRGAIANAIQSSTFLREFLDGIRELLRGRVDGPGAIPPAGEGSLVIRPEDNTAAMRLLVRLGIFLNSFR